MSRHQIDYESLAQDAMRGLVRTVMQRIAKTGLPGDHHFYISFHTRGAGATLSKRLLERYPEEMTIVLQNKFSDLKATEDRFEVTLWFDSIAERLTVPYAAIKVFFDPSVPFGHQFEVAEASADPAPHGPVLIDTETGGRTAEERRTESRQGPVTSVSTSPNTRSRQAGQGQTAAPKDAAKAETTKSSSKAPISAVPGSRQQVSGAGVAGKLAPAPVGGKGHLPTPMQPDVGRNAQAGDRGVDKPSEKEGKIAAASPEKNIPAPKPVDGESEPANSPAAKVVALDAFRKKS